MLKTLGNAANSSGELISIGSMLDYHSSTAYIFEGSAGAELCYVYRLSYSGYLDIYNITRSPMVYKPRELCWGWQTTNQE